MCWMTDNSGLGYVTYYVSSMLNFVDAIKSTVSIYTFTSNTDARSSFRLLALNTIQTVSTLKFESRPPHVPLT